MVQISYYFLLLSIHKTWVLYLLSILVICATVNGMGGGGGRSQLLSEWNPDVFEALVKSIGSELTSSEGKDQKAKCSLDPVKKALNMKSKENVEGIREATGVGSHSA